MRAAQTEMSCCLSKAKCCLPKRVEGRQQQIFRIPCYASSAAEDTSNMCLLFSSACFREEHRGRLDPVSQFYWSHPFTKLGFPSGLSPFSSGLAGSLSSSLHENYSMGELKECGVHSVEQLASVKSSPVLN